MHREKNNLCQSCGRRTAGVFCTKCDRQSYNREYYRLNRERMLATALKWNFAHPDKCRLYHQRYDRRKLEVGG